MSEKIKKLTKKNVRELARMARDYNARFEYGDKTFVLTHKGSSRGLFGRVEKGYSLYQAFNGLYKEQTDILFGGRTMSSIDDLYRAMKNADEEDGLGFDLDPSFDESDIEHEPIDHKNLEGRKAILSRSYLDAPIESRIVECSSGFGCNPKNGGNAVFGKLIAEEESERFERYMFEAVVVE